MQINKIGRKTPAFTCVTERAAEAGDTVTHPGRRRAGRVHARAVVLARHRVTQVCRQHTMQFAADDVIILKFLCVPRSGEVVCPLCTAFAHAQRIPPSPSWMINCQSIENPGSLPYIPVSQNVSANPATHVQMK